MSIPGQLAGDFLLPVVRYLPAEGYVSENFRMQEIPSLRALKFLVDKERNSGEPSPNMAAEMSTPQVTPQVGPQVSFGRLRLSTAGNNADGLENSYGKEYALSPKT